MMVGRPNNSSDDTIAIEGMAMPSTSNSVANSNRRPFIENHDEGNESDTESVDDGSDYYPSSDEDSDSPCKDPVNRDIQNSSSDSSENGDDSESDSNHHYDSDDEWRDIDERYDAHSCIDDTLLFDV
ncbi:hypothetical protein QAD02_008120 [Eretmocerus hayati]|uniref:Uncharacterized protein n=1 Tax=Eretmocerus hayati TaxID=131215 RepID=A0ACC2N5M1_9HYME|nr:hypothetical protein QAD02_008120 [Eretmocerus hayati]